MRIALSVWNGRIAPLFDVAGTLVVTDTGKEAAISSMEIALPGAEAQMQRMAFLEANRVEVLICGAVSRQVHRLIASVGIEVHPFVSGDAEKVLEAFLQGSLDEDSFRMPGCGMGRCRGDGRGAGRNRRGRNRNSCPAVKRGVECQVETEQAPSVQDPEGESV